MSNANRKSDLSALVGKLIGAAAGRLEACGLAFTGASLDPEVRKYAFPFLPDGRGLSFPITDRQSLNHFLVYGPHSPTRSRLLFDIAESKVVRGSGLLHVSTLNGCLASEMEERTRQWSRSGAVAVVTYDGTSSISNLSWLNRVLRDQWLVFVRLPDPARDSEIAAAAAARFCADLRALTEWVEMKDGDFGPRAQFNTGSRVFSHPPTPIVFDDASWYVNGLSGILAARLKALGFSIVYGLESDTAFGSHHPAEADEVLANAMTKVVMGDQIVITCGCKQMPRLAPKFFAATSAYRKRWEPPMSIRPA